MNSPADSLDWQKYSLGRSFLYSLNALNHNLQAKGVWVCGALAVERVCGFGCGGCWSSSWALPSAAALAWDTEHRVTLNLMVLRNWK